MGLGESVGCGREGGMRRSVQGAAQNSEGGRDGEVRWHRLGDVAWSAVCDRNVTCGRKGGRGLFSARFNRSEIALQLHSLSAGGSPCRSAKVTALAE